MLRPRAILLASALAALSFFGAAPSAHADKPPHPSPPPHPPNAASKSGLDLIDVSFLLIGGGLVGGAAGFSILYACRRHEPCHGDAATVTGWIFAAPGIPPLTLGVLFLAAGLASEPKSQKTVQRPPGPRAPSVTWTAGPLPGGAAVGARLMF